MRTIKFRGKVAAECEGYAGQTVYGSLIIYALGSTHWINSLEDERGYPVEPDSVAQMVGYDSNGAEIYEGDTLTNTEGENFQACLTDAVLTDEGFLHNIPFEVLMLKVQS